VRIVSIGTGMAYPTPIDPTDLTQVTWLEQIASSFITSVE